MADTHTEAEFGGVAGGAHWWPVGFGNRDGDVVQAWACPLPADFADRLEKDEEGLRQETAEQAAAEGGRLIEANRVMVDGRPAFRRIVRLPSGAFPAAVYVAALVVPLDSDVGVEITVTCGAIGDLLGGW
ncbi:MAG TPA: hypothetical protein VE465_19795 [Streptosporangiaceae bacterium]|jgi:hypothetical protein|nr:hypothetical protein [Streptosporangiaceae bacterium]